MARARSDSQPPGPGKVSMSWLHGICGHFYEDAFHAFWMFSGVNEDAPQASRRLKFSDFADQVGLCQEPGSNTLQHMLELPLPPQWSMEEGYMGQIYFFNCVAGETWDCIPLCAAVSTCIVTAPERVSADVSAQEAAQTFVQAVAENKDFLVSSAGFGVSVASAVWTYRQVQEAERATAEAKRQAEEAFKQSDEYKVIHRKVMHAIADRVKTWDEHATIISCRFQTGKTVAVEEILRGAQGIFKHAVKDEHWEEKLT
eukprot:s4727_g3.t2